MRKFTVECKDDKTGYSMVLSECSYNMACDWLSRILKKYDCEIYRTEFDSVRNLTLLFTGRYIVEDQKFIRNRIFFYDEERGYLLGE